MERVIYLRPSCRDKEVVTYYLYYEIKDSECYQNATNLHPVFWVDYLHGWAIYCKESKLKNIAPITYSELVQSKNEGEELKKVFRNDIEKELMNIKDNYPEYQGRFYNNGVFDTDRFIF